MPPEQPANSIPNVVNTTTPLAALSKPAFNAATLVLNSPTMQGALNDYATALASDMKARKANSGTKEAKEAVEKALAGLNKSLKESKLLDGLGQQDRMAAMDGILQTMELRAGERLQQSVNLNPAAPAANVKGEVKQAPPGAAR